MKDLIKIITCTTLAFLSFTLPAQNKGLDFFTGKWDFKIWFSEKTSGKPDLTATWLLEKGPDSATCFIGQVRISGKLYTREMISLNSVKKEYVRTLSTHDGAYIVLKTKGWDGDTLVWTGVQYLSGKKTELKEEIQKSGPNEFKARFYTFKDKAWQQTQTEILSRTS